MLAEVLERLGAGGWIVLLVGKVGGLLGGFIFQAEPAIEDRQNLVGGKIVRVDRLHGLVFCTREVGLVLLMEGEPEFAMGVAGTWELCRDFLQIDDGLLYFAAISFDQGKVIERAHCPRSTRAPVEVG
jgi:hypothetical protein